MNKVIRFIVKYGGILIAAINFVEELSSDNVSGEDKKKAAIEFIHKSEGIFNFKVPFTDEQLGQIIDVLVAIANALGFFKHKEKK